jgi:diacylglycerol kinase (ATP)
VTDAPCLRHGIIILNPAAGNGRAGARRSELEELLARATREHGGDSGHPPVEWRIVETRVSGETIDLAAKAVQEGADIVAAAGGDGTCGEVAQGIVGTGARLGVLPMGSGNDFARMLGLHSSELSQAVQALFTGVLRPIDLGRTQTNHDQLECNLFATIAGCGFDAVATQRALQGFRLFHGRAGYFAAVICSIFTYRSPNMTVTVDGESTELKGMLCSVCNTRSYGGGMKVAPDALIDDGLFDICLLRDASILEFLMAFPRVYKGTHVTHPKVQMMRGKVVEVVTDPPLPVLIDGEVIGKSPVTFTMLPKALEVMFPV